MQSVQLVIESNSQLKTSEDLNLLTHFSPVS